MQKRYRIIRKFDDHEPVYLGTVVAPAGMDERRQVQLIEEAWEECRDDDDLSDFPSYLERQYGFTIVAGEEDIELE